MEPNALKEALEAQCDDEDNDEDDGEDDGERPPLDAPARRAIDLAVAELTAEIGLSHHGDASELKDLICARGTRNAPNDAARIIVLANFTIWKLASELRLTLKDAHSALLRTDARHYAEQILEAEGPFSRPFLRAVQRDIAYRWLKRLDPVCTTKAAADPVAIELGALVNASR